MAVNKALLRRLARKLRRIRHEEHYNQREFARKTDCGTACCIAGLTVVEAGFKLNWHPRSRQTGRITERVSDTSYIPAVAQELLGLEYQQASVLFTGTPCGGKRAIAEWPEEFAKRWRRGKERKSRIAADLLDAVADTDGKILS